MIIVLSLLAVVTLLMLVCFVNLQRKRKNFKRLQKPPIEKVSIDENQHQKAVQALSALIKCKTVSYPDSQKMDWAQFEKLHQAIQVHYPLVSQKLKKEIIGRAAIVYCFESENKDLKPILLIAHQDVVPVQSDKSWQYGPFDGTVAEGYIWGRGSFDCKLQLASALSSVEIMLEKGIKPRRTIYLAFGYNEEVMGDAAHLVAAHFKKQGLEFEFVLDEGGAVMDSVLKQVKEKIGAIGVAEKGHMNLSLSVRLSGGHSSTPKNPTSLGVLAKAIAKIESSQMRSQLVSPMIEFFNTIACCSKGPIALVFGNLWLFKPLVFKIFKQTPKNAVYVRTTHAATMAQGSNATNVISELSTANINFRLLGADTVEDVIKWVKKVVRDDRVEIRPRVGDCNAQSSVSSVTTDSYLNLDRAVRAVFENTITVPYLLAGGSDARTFSELSPNIYRFSPALMDYSEISRMHNANERISVENVKRAIEFTLTLLYNC